MKRCSLKFMPVLLMILALRACSFAQSAAETKAPVPSEIFTAKTVFIANGGANSELFSSPFSGTPSRGYDEFYSAMKKWGHYQLVDNPQNAELVMEIRLIAPTGPEQQEMKVDTNAPGLSMFQLVVYDRETHYPLWTLTDSVQSAVMQKTHDHNFDLAIEGLVTQLEQLKTQH